MRILLITLSGSVSTRVRLLILALLLASLELFIPRLPFLPWLKPGLANIVTIVWLYKFGFIDTLLYGVLRVWILSLFFGFSFFSTTLGISGMVLSVSVMWLLLGVMKKGGCGLITVGVLGALMHNIGQMVIITPMVGEVFSIQNQIVFMLPASLITGALTSWGASVIIRENTFSNSGDYTQTVCVTPLSSISRLSYIMSFGLFFLAVTLLFVKDLYIVVCVLVGFYLLASSVEKSMVKPLLPAKRSILFILCVFLSFLPFNSNDRVIEAGMQIMKLLTWLIMTSLFKIYNFNAILFSYLRKVFRKQAETLDAALVVAEVFPTLLDVSHFLKMEIRQSGMKGFIPKMTKEVDTLLEKELAKIEVKNR